MQLVAIFLAMLAFSVLPGFTLIRALIPRLSKRLTLAVSPALSFFLLLVLAALLSPSSTLWLGKLGFFPDYWRWKPATVFPLITLLSVIFAALATWRRRNIGSVSYTHLCLTSYKLIRSVVVPKIPINRKTVSYLVPTIFLSLIHI